MKNVALVHIPHASTHIPPDVRREILLNDEELNQEILFMTDLYTDEILIDPEISQILQSPVSRLVVDVERFRDDEQEGMAKVGMGAVYTMTHDGRPLRLLDAERKEELSKRYYDPHHERLEQAVKGILDRLGICLIIDIHSFPAVPLPYESDSSLDRPDICLGTDASHTPDYLFESARAYFEKHGLRVKKDSPFKGTMVPFRYYRLDPRVLSIMVEINRKWMVEEDLISKKAEAHRVLRILSDWIKEVGGRL